MDQNCDAKCVMQHIPGHYDFLNKNLKDGWTIIEAHANVDGTIEFLLRAPNKDRELNQLLVIKKMYEHLNEEVRKLCNHVLGPEYYNEGGDVYSCNEFTFKDLKRAFDKGRIPRCFRNRESRRNCDD